MSRMMRATRSFEYHVIPARGQSGGLCLAWRQGMEVQVLNSSANYICVRFSPKDKPPWILVGVYGDPKHHRNRWLWETMTQIIQLHGAVCLMGDFNEILSSEEKYGGNSNLKSNTIDFQNFTFDSGLVDVRYKGPAYTWTNKRNVSEAIYERLDRVLVTPDWLQLYPNAYVNHLPMIHSDHCPILFRIKKPPDRSNNFRIENWWMLEDDFQDKWVNDWKATERLPSKERWKSIRNCMKQWAVSHLTPKKKLEKLANQIQKVQMQHPSMRDHAMEEALLVEYEKAELQHEQYWQQRSRMEWHNLGDRNTRFFHTVATNRRRFNLITMIRNEDGNLTGCEKVIRKQLVKYFSDLYSPTQNSLLEAPPGQSQIEQNFWNVLQQDIGPKIPTTAHYYITKPQNTVK
ncbi:Non-LTR reverse transcriptase [Rhynchospora pubera]|uniref:Non-LTR reverse transcriptase n=1 Tax=Rhynchospora pubera TaxID=906938 RepID=A0AAV8H908_9POAL|nr:Non-LTR reverse transcriptase [Rhynchospora pubera]